MFTISKKERRKLNKKIDKYIVMIGKIERNEYVDSINSKHVLLKFYGKEIEDIKKKLFISKYCF